MTEIVINKNINKQTFWAICFVNSATGSTTKRSMTTNAEGLCFINNPSYLYAYLYAIKSEKGLNTHQKSFSTIPNNTGQTDIETLTVQQAISDPLQKYLTRTKQIVLKQNPEPDSDDALSDHWKKELGKKNWEEEQN